MRTTSFLKCSIPWSEYLVSLLTATSLPPSSVPYVVELFRLIRRNEKVHLTTVIVKVELCYLVYYAKASFSKHIGVRETTCSREDVFEADPQIF